MNKTKDSLCIFENVLKSLELKNKNISVYTNEFDLLGFKLFSNRGTHIEMGYIPDSIGFYDTNINHDKQINKHEFYLIRDFDNVDKFTTLKIYDFRRNIVNQIENFTLIKLSDSEIDNLIQSTNKLNMNQDEPQVSRPLERFYINQDEVDFDNDSQSTQPYLSPPPSYPSEDLTHEEIQQMLKMEQEHLNMLNS